jgi:hypothetical protein
MRLCVYTADDDPTARTEAFTWYYYTGTTGFRHNNLSIPNPQQAVRSPINFSYDPNTNIVWLNYGNQGHAAVDPASSSSTWLDPVTGNTAANPLGSPEYRIVFEAISAAYNNIKFLSFEIWNSEVTGNAPPTTANRNESSNTLNGIWRELFRFTMPGNNTGNDFDLAIGEKFRLAGLFVRCFTGRPQTETFVPMKMEANQTVTVSAANTALGDTNLFGVLTTTSGTAVGDRYPIRFYKTGDRLYYAGPAVLAAVTSGSQSATQLRVYDALTSGNLRLTINVNKAVDSSTYTSVVGDVAFMDSSQAGQFLTIVG